MFSSQNDVILTRIRHSQSLLKLANVETSPPRYEEQRMCFQFSDFQTKQDSAAVISLPSLHNVSQNPLGFLCKVNTCVQSVFRHNTWESFLLHPLTREISCIFLSAVFKYILHFKAFPVCPPADSCFLSVTKIELTRCDVPDPSVYTLSCRYYW